MVSNRKEAGMRYYGFVQNAPEFGFVQEIFNSIVSQIPSGYIRLMNELEVWPRWPFEHFVVPELDRLLYRIHDMEVAKAAVYEWIIAGNCACIDPKEARETFEAVLNVLKAKEKEVVHRLYVAEGADNTTLQEVADDCGLSRERIRQIRNKALHKLGQTVSFNKLSQAIFRSTRDRYEIAQARATALANDYAALAEGVEQTIVALKQVPFVDGLLRANQSSERNDILLQLRHDEVRERILETAIEDLVLSVRAYNCLKNSGIKTVGELATKTDADLMEIKHFGHKSLSEIKEILASMDLSLGMRLK